MIERDPATPLRTYVRRYYGFSETTESLVRRREGPGVDVIVLLSFGCEWRIGDATAPTRAAERRTSFVAGLHEAAVLTEHDGRSHGLQISLTPPGAYALLGLPLHELAGRTVPLDALLGGDGDRLVARLEEMPGWTERFRLLDATLAARVAEARQPVPGVVWAWNRLRQTDGRVRIGDLGGELGWSRKRLVARFRDQVGLGPKAVARLYRFERAKAMLEADERLSLAELALECGYFDQAHLSNEVRRITGTTPAAYAAELHAGTNLQDAVGPRS